jgi:hypothetical protein
MPSANRKSSIGGTEVLGLFIKKMSAFFTVSSRWRWSKSDDGPQGDDDLSFHPNEIAAPSDFCGRTGRKAALSPWSSGSSGALPAFHDGHGGLCKCHSLF